ncbi:MAG: tRNA uridine-5-carboxymethylaminomethyl(34) synthesis GTPase MnmE [Bacilli bacterium]|nr:tRNA uridine-5-carboxymethylaminomethyl(34) synthesis GTPase MnmE [Bacilli bacterium]
MNDTIAAISTPLGVGAISIIRISGEEAINIVNKIFKGKDLNEVDSHTINYGHIYEQDKLIDEVLVSVMLKPNTFTREDVVEINSHGGIATTNKILELLLVNGCRLAEPGEFTKRAFLNGRIDLIEAEGVMDLINAKTEKSMELAVNQVNGYTSNLIRNLREELVRIIANINVNIDYPEYEDIKEVTNNDIIQNLSSIEEKIKKIINSSKDNQLINDGIKTAIVGSPNVGKSSILNKLLDEEKAIVTDIPGTTRDIVEGQILINGIKLKIIDTAGIRKTSDIVENIGVEKSLKVLQEADFVIYVLNNNEEMTQQDLELISKIKEKDYLIVINKIDLDNRLNYSMIEQDRIVKVSALNDDCVELIRNKICELFKLEELNNQDFTYISNAYSLSLLNKSLDKIQEIKQALSDELPIDFIEMDLRTIWNLLGEVIGETYTEELIDKLFSQFCLGK